jgi:hypothetical protein
MPVQLLSVLVAPVLLVPVLLVPVWSLWPVRPVPPCLKWS